MALVEFSQGLYDDYVDIPVKLSNQLYFCTDTKQIFLGNQEYTANVKQFTEMPLTWGQGAIVQYTGTTTSDYVNGYFYQMTDDGWEQVNTQPYEPPISITFAEYQQLSPQEIAANRYIIIDYPGSGSPIGAADVTYQNTTVYNALNNIIGNIAPTESTSTASQAYDVNNYLIDSTGQLCRVTTAISQGDIIVVGTTSGCNCVATSIAYELANAHIKFTII